MTWVSSIPLSQLQENGRETAVVNGEKILLIWHQDKVHAIQPNCPHLRYPLGKAPINENDELICPLHKSTFDLNTGEANCWSTSPPVVGPLLGKVRTKRNLRIYKTKVEDDQILIDV